MNPANKAAFLIGINYVGTEHELKSCRSDVIKVSKVLIDNYNYDPETVILLTETSNRLPTKKNILNCLNYLISNLKKGDQLYIHYSGHGNLNSKNSKSVEVIYPVDWKISGSIKVSEMNNMVKKAVLGSKIIFILDSCNSGAIFDLKYQIKNNKNNKYVEIINSKSKLLCDMIVFESSGDNLNSYEFMNDNGVYEGAMTTAFISTLKENNYKVTPLKLLNGIKTYLKEEKIPQVPELTAQYEKSLKEILIL